MKFGELLERIGTESGHKMTQRVIEHRPEIPPGRVPGSSQIDPGTLPEHPRTQNDRGHRRRNAKVGASRHESRPRETILGPRRDPKIDQNRARGRKSGSRRPFFAVFSAVAHGSRFSHRCGVSFGRVRPSKHGQITILSSISRKPRFSEKHRKSTLRGLIFDPKVATISAGATKNRKNPPQK